MKQFFPIVVQGAATFSLSFAIIAATPCSTKARSADKVPTYRIETVAGTSEAGFSGDGGPAVKARLRKPTAVAVDSKGIVYIADFDNNRIRRIGLDGIISTYAGVGEAGFGGDGGPASAALLNHPYGVSVGPDDLVYISDQRNHRVRKIDRYGIITTIAGNGVNGGDGDGGPALEASLSFPDDVAFDSKGAMYIADGDRVRVVYPDGRIDTFAGSGVARYNRAAVLSGDGGPAKKATFATVSAVAMDRKDNLYIADLRNHAMRRIDSSGVITTIAGMGEGGYNGAGFAATKALLDEPGGVDLTPDGSLVIADGVNYRIRVVTPDGVIHTIAGTGERGYSGDGGPALLAKLSVLDILDVDRRGAIYFSDFGNHAVRRLVPDDRQVVDWAADPETLLTRVRDAYASVQKVSLNITEILPHAAPRTGKISYERNGVVEATFSIPNYGDVHVASDGCALTVEDPTLGRPITARFSRNALNREMIGNLTTYSFWDWANQLSTSANMSGSVLTVSREDWNDKRYIVLNEAAGDLKVKYFIDPDRFIIARTVQERDGKQTYESFLSSLEGL